MSSDEAKVSGFRKFLESLRPETPEEYTRRFIEGLRRSVGAPEGYVLAFVPPEAFNGNVVNHAVIIRPRTPHNGGKPNG